MAIKSTTSLLQQEAINRFGFSAKMVMRLAQNLYERGLITYHRTDSFYLSTSFVFGAKDFITKQYGKQYALVKPRGYKTRSKSAQEAHEAIRPTKIERTPRMLEKENSLTASHKKIYELIYNRAVATQMADAKIKQIEIFIQGEKGYLFESEHSKII
ncbi:DNA topoisomerase I, partial [Candidatus Roizmanbacteria bacterium]|nr:DNA topoisomerase I [Candidatus Roizmanbacteria bacterium]